MSLFSKQEDSLLDRAVADVKGEDVDPAVIERAAARVWDRLSQIEASADSTLSETASPAPVQVQQGPLRGCDDFQQLMPAYLRGELAPARVLLLEDHTRGCIPCRRALVQARSGQPAVQPAAQRKAPRWTIGPKVRTAIAATLLAAVGTGVFFAAQEYLPGAAAQTARIESVDGLLFRLDGDQVERLSSGDKLKAGEEIRTAKGSTAYVRLSDGSRVEMSERAGLSFDARRSGTTVNLGQGRILVQAAKQKEDKHLWVATGDCKVEVVGTIFSVNHGTKGSRVSVVEGEVHVRQASRESVLHPGDQVTTSARVARLPITQEIAWSRDAERYRQLLAQLTPLGREIDDQLGLPNLRTSTRLLDLAPAGTVAWVGLPNLASNLSETQRLLDARLRDNEMLRQWWGDVMGSGDRAEKFRGAIERMGKLGKHLGDEIAVAVTEAGPVVLAEATNAAAFRAEVDQQLAELNGGQAHLNWVSDPNQAVNTEHGLLLWLGGDVFVATPDANLLRQVAANVQNPAANPFAASRFHDRVSEVYQDGTGWLFSGDLQTLLHRDPGATPTASQTAEKLGILDLEDFILDRRELADRSETRATLTFDRPRRGIASWLAAPAPMRTLDFISPDANLVAAFVVKDPSSMLDDLLAAIPEFGTELGKLSTEHGIDLRELAATLGGEVALAVDGPLVPTPAWKLVLEVYDPNRLQAAMRDLVGRLDAKLRQEGKPGVTFTTQTVGGRTYSAVTLRTGNGNGANGPAVHYLFADGFLIAAPSRALLDRTLDQRASGATLATSAAFQDLLPEDRQVNFSALVFHDLGKVLAPLAPVAGQVASQMAGAGQPSGTEGRDRAANLLAAGGPGLVYAYGQEDRIVFAGNHARSPLGFNLGTLAGLGGLGGFSELLDEASRSAHNSGRSGETR